MVNSSPDTSLTESETNIKPWKKILDNTGFQCQCKATCNSIDCECNLHNSPCNLECKCQEFCTNANNMYYNFNKTLQPFLNFNF
jgi:hypothetical protein